MRTFSKGEKVRLLLKIEHEGSLEEFWDWGRGSALYDCFPAEFDQCDKDGCWKNLEKKVYALLGYDTDWNEEVEGDLNDYNYILDYPKHFMQ